MKAQLPVAPAGLAALVATVVPGARVVLAVRAGPVALAGQQKRTVLRAPRAHRAKVVLMAFKGSPGRPVLMAMVATGWRLIVTT